MKALWENQPDFVNEEGTKWWFDKDTTDYVKTVEEQRTIELNMIVWLVERKDGYMTRIVIDTETNEPIYENQSLESVAVFIDTTAVSREFDRKEK